MSERETLQGRPRSPTTEEVEEPARSLVLARVGDAWLGFDAEFAERIADASPVTELPRSPPHIEGLMLIGARAVPVLDLAALLGIESADTDTSDERPERMLVVESGELRGAVRCSSVKVARDVPSAALGPVVVARREGLVRFAEHEVDVDGDVVVVVDMGAVLEAARVQRK